MNLDTSDTSVRYSRGSDHCTRILLAVDDGRERMQDLRHRGLTIRVNSLVYRLMLSSSLWAEEILGSFRVAKYRPEDTKHYNGHGSTVIGSTTKATSANSITIGQTSTWSAP